MVDDAATPGPDASDRPPCRDADCEGSSDFWQYGREAGWRPVCERHALARHPSLEIKAWLWSGYMVPVERERPTEPPDEPEYGRTAAFRREVDAAMGWTE